MALPTPIWRTRHAVRAISILSTPATSWKSWIWVVVERMHAISFLPVISMKAVCIRWTSLWKTITPTVTPNVGTIVWMRISILPRLPFCRWVSVVRWRRWTNRAWLRIKFGPVCCFRLPLVCPKCIPTVTCQLMRMVTLILGWHLLNVDTTNSGVTIFRPTSLWIKNWPSSPKDWILWDVSALIQITTIISAVSNVLSYGVLTVIERMTVPSTSPAKRKSRWWIRLQAIVESAKNILKRNFSMPAISRDICWTEHWNTRKTPKWEHRKSVKKSSIRFLSVIKGWPVVLPTTGTIVISWTLTLAILVQKTLLLVISLVSFPPIRLPGTSPKNPLSRRTWSGWICLKCAIRGVK